VTDAQRDHIAAAATTRYRLTPRCAQVLRALLDGVPRGYLARELRVGEQTIKSHVKRLLSSTVCDSTDQLVWLLRGWPESAKDPTPLVPLVE
jgi:DNA-binding NarL/FixJ family response regulator